MGRVLHLGPSWHGPIFMWAKLAWAELVLGRVVLHPIEITHQKYKLIVYTHISNFDVKNISFINGVKPGVTRWDINHTYV